MGAPTIMIMGETKERHAMTAMTIEARHHSRAACDPLSISLFIPSLPFSTLLV